MTEFPASRWELRCAVNACTAEWVLLDAADALEELPDPVLAVPARGMATVGVGLAPGWGLDGCFRSCPRVLGLPNGCCSAVAVSLTKVNLASAVTPQARGHLVEPEEASAENNETMPKLGRPISGARCKQTAPKWANYKTRRKAQCLLPTQSILIDAPMSACGQNHSHQSCGPLDTLKDLPHRRINIADGCNQSHFAIQRSRCLLPTLTPQKTFIFCKTMRISWLQKPCNFCRYHNAPKACICCGHQNRGLQVGFQRVKE